MPEKEIITQIPPLWVWVTSFFGGSVGYLEVIQLEDTWRVKVVKGMIRVSSSVFAGYLTYYFLVAMDTGEKWWPLYIGISSWLGNEALRTFGDWFKARVNKP